MTAARTGAPLTPNSPIPKKLYFKIGEVSQLVGVRAHVLRYWEKEISSIRPTKSASNQRRYRRRDVELFREIRRLLYEERYTLAGARKRLLSGSREARESEESQPTVALEGHQDDAPGASDETASTSDGGHDETEPETEAHTVQASLLPEERSGENGSLAAVPSAEPVASLAPAAVVANPEESAAQLGNGSGVHVGSRAELERSSADPETRPQLPFSFEPDHDRLQRVRDGLHELIRLADRAE